MKLRMNAPIASGQLLSLFHQTDFADDRDNDGCARRLATARPHVSAWEGDLLVGFRRITHELADVDEIQLGCEEDHVPFYERPGWTRGDGAVMAYEGTTS